MADYYHTARAAKKHIEQTQKENKRNRELRGELGQHQIEHPLNVLNVQGRPLKVHVTSIEHHAAINRLDGLIPWNGDPDNLVDRFDCRCMLDFYREPASASSNEHKPAGDPKLLQLLQFEAFRDLVKYTSRGLPEEKGIEAAQEESLAIRAQARVEATAAFRIQNHQAQPGDITTAAASNAGTGAYSAVGFQYDGAEESETSSSSSGSGSEGDESDIDDRDPGAQQEEDAEDAEDDIAEMFGITDFNWRLHRALAQEGEEDAKRRMPRKRSNRKRARAKARRLAGMGLDPKGKSLMNWHDPLATNAPSAHLIRPRRPSPEGGHDRSRSPSRRTRSDPLGALRDLPTAPSTHIDRKAFERDDNIIDALPDMPDPAMSGPQPFPAASALQNVRLQQENQRRERERDREYRRYRRRSRSRSRGRYRRRSRSFSPHSKSSSRRRPRHSRSRSRDGDRRRRHSSSPSSRSRSPRASKHGEGSVPDRQKPAPQAAKSAAPETPAERMKRIIAAQLNKQSSTDSLKGLNKRR